MTNSNIIVLRKTPFSETSLVVASISAEHGRLDFLVRGARKIDKKKYPEVDLFRELNVHFREASKGLHSINSVELVSSYDSIASRTDNFIAASEMAEFLLRNSHPMLPSPRLYSALKGALKILSAKKVEEPLTALLKLVFLEEHGLLSLNLKNTDDENRRRRILEYIINSLAESKEFPAFGQEYWRSLSDWINDLCTYHSL